MVNVTTLKNELYGQVGARQVTDSNYDSLVYSLLVSRSGRFIQDEHPLLTIENIDQCARHFNRRAYTAYNGATTYSLGDQVLYEDTPYEYISSTDASGNLPTDTDFWMPIPNLSDYLIAKQEAAIQMVIDQMLSHKKLNKSTKAIYENILLFDGVGNLSNKEINTGKFVGLRIVLKNFRSLVSIINAIGTQLSGAKDFTMYLFHSSQKTAIATFSISHTKATSFEWHKLTANNEIKYWSSSYDVGGEFYLGYYQDDISGVQAINKDYTWGQTPCGSCNRNNAYYYNNWSEYADITAFEVSNGDFTNVDVWDYQDVRYVYDKNFGLNLNLTTRCELTDFILQERYLFNESIAMQWAYLLLQDIAYNTRNNIISKQVRDMAMFEINSRERGSITDRLKQSIKAMSFDFSELNDACLACDDKFGSNWGTF
jgi:hypothetical protein